MATRKEVKKMAPNLAMMKMHPNFPMPGSPQQQQPIELAPPTPSGGQGLGDLYNN